MLESIPLQSVQNSVTTAQQDSIQMCLERRSASIVPRASSVRRPAARQNQAAPHALAARTPLTQGRPSAPHAPYLATRLLLVAHQMRHVCAQLGTRVIRVFHAKEARSKLLVKVSHLEIFWLFFSSPFLLH